MKASAIVRSLHCLLDAQRPAFIWGPPGIGKSDVVAQVADERQVALKDLRVILLDAVDLRGLPYLSDGQTKWAIPDFLPRKGKGILFLDELNAAPALVQAGCYQLVLDRKLGDYTVPDGWSILAAGNRESDRSVTTRMPTALRSRFVHLNFEVDRLEWKNWAIRNSIRPEVIGFIDFRPQLLHQFDRDATAFPCPRTWKFVSDILERNPSPTIELELIAGTVGNAAATECVAFFKTFRTLPNIDAILLSPETAALPAKADAQYAVACALSCRATEVNFGQICRYLDRMPPEFSVLCVKDAIKLAPDVQHTPEFTKWALAHDDVLN
jgi:hypothetical protein